MNGWNTKHQEFTPAYGEPVMIQHLITEFNLEQIVKFDQPHSLIITTIQHDQYIRLSDILTLNITNKVIAFTLPQYIEVIRKLLEQLEAMKEQQIQHGNLEMENILLDFTQSQYKLDNKPVEITFQLKLINFAQFYNLAMKDDFEQLIQIYNKIIEYFPKYKNEQDLKNIQETKSKAVFLECLEQIIYKFITSSQKDQQKYSWDSSVFSAFQQNYSEYPPLLKNFNQINDLVQQLHQYHLIVNHYQDLIYSYLNSWFFKQIPYSREPQNLIKVSSFIDQKFNLNLINLQNIKQLMGDQQFNKAIETYKVVIQTELIIFLKIQGCFVNINQFVEIDNNIGQINDFQKEIFLKITQYSLFELNNIQFQNDILAFYVLSQQILKGMVKKKIIELLIDSNMEGLSKEVAQIENFLIEKLNYIKQIGFEESKRLVDHCFNKSLGRNVQDQSLQNSDNLIQFLVQQWLKWIDYHIVNQNIGSLEELVQIKNETFMEFIQESGFKLLKAEMKNLIEQMLQSLINRCNGNPLIREQIEYIKREVKTNYSNNYICVKDALCDQIIVQFCQSIDLNQEISVQIKIFNENQQQTICQYMSIIQEQYKTESSIANNTFNQNWSIILLQCQSQPLFPFKYYQNKLKEEKLQFKGKYLNLVQFEPKQQQSQFQNHCLAVFNELLKGSTSGLQLNLEASNLHAKTALSYLQNQYHVMLQRLRSQYQNDVESVNWTEVEKLIFERFYEQWSEGMNNHQIDELLDLKVYEQQIQSITKNFIKMASQEGQYYFFDEEYQIINQNAQINQIRGQKLSSISRQLYLEIANTLESDLLLEMMKNVLIDKIIIQELIPKEFMKISYFYGQAIQLLFNQIRCQLWETNGKCSFYELLGHYQSSDNLIMLLSEFIPQNPEQTQLLMITLGTEYDTVLTSIRNKFKIYIKSDEEYHNVVDEQDPLFLEIIHHPKTSDLDQDQVTYLEKQIDKYQKVKYLEWLNCCWNKYKNETQKYQNIDEENWNQSFQTLQSDIIQSISNKLNQLDISKTLETQFRRQWIRKHNPKIIVAFVDICEE